MTLLALAWLQTAQAEPYMAIREGLPCAQCHVNHTGGGMRNPYGVVFGQTSLAAWESLGRGVDGEPKGALPNPSLSDSVSFGANLRLNNTTIFPYQSRFNGRVVSNVDGQNSFEVPEGNLYTRIDAIPDQLLFYIDQTVSPDFNLREAFVLLEGLPADTWVKVGQLLQPYGVRLLDDATSTRAVTQYRYDTPQLGAEVGIDHRPLHGSLALTNAGGGSLGKKVVGSLQLVFPVARFGLSGSSVDESTDTISGRKQTAGGFGGLQLGRLGLLAEADVIRSRRQGEGKIDQMVSFIEADLLAARGLNLKLATDYHDRNLAVPQDHRSRVVFGIETFPLRSLQLSALYQKRLDIPQAPAADQADRFTLQAHGFF